MRELNKDFFFEIDMDSHNRISNVFWVDVSRAAFMEFGDVVSFETTYLTNKYDMCNIPGYPSSGPRGCQVTTAQCTPTHHPSPSIHTGWVVASGNRTPNLTFNTSGSLTDATSYAL